MENFLSYFRKFSFPALFLLVLTGGNEILGANYFPPPESQGGWRKNTDPSFVESLGFNANKLKDLTQYSMGINGFSCLVIKDGWIIAEEYSSPDQKYAKPRLFSCGKSYAMLAFGAVIKNRGTGVIPADVSIDSKVYDKRWLSEGFPLSDPKKSQITFLHIFHHESGMVPEDEGGFSEAPSPYVEYTVGHADPDYGKLYYDPGQSQQYWGDPYSSIAFDHMSIVITNMTGIKSHDYLKQKIMDPIGAEDWYVDTRDGYWLTDGHIYSTARDYGRYTYFLMKDGNWNGNKPMVDNWVERFRTTGLADNIQGNADGFFGSKFPKDLFRVGGYGLNNAYIIPSLNVIALRTGMYTGSWPVAESTFVQKLLDAYQLPVNKKDKIKFGKNGSFTQGHLAFPNPISNTANFKFEQSQYKDFYIRIFSLNGQAMGASTVNSFPNQVLKPGFYVARFRIGPKVYNRKFSVIR